MVSQSSAATESETVFSFNDDLLAFEDAEFPDDESIGFSGLASNVIPLEIFEQSAQSIVSLEFHESFISIGSPTQRNKPKVSGMDSLEFHESFISIAPPTQPKNPKVSGTDSLYTGCCDLESEEDEETSKLQALSERSSVSKASKARTTGSRTRHKEEEAGKTRSRTNHRSGTGRKSIRSGAGSSSSSKRRQRSSQKSKRKDATSESNSACPSTRRSRETDGPKLRRSSTSSSAKSIEERSKHRENYTRTRRERSLRRHSERATLRSFVSEIEARHTKVRGSPQPERFILARGRSLRAIPTGSILSSQLLDSISYHTATNVEASKEFSSDFLKPAGGSPLNVWDNEKVTQAVKNESGTYSTHQNSGITPLLKKVAKSTSKFVRNSLYTGNSSSTQKLLRDSGRSYINSDDYSVATSACQSFAI